LVVFVIDDIFIVVVVVIAVVVIFIIVPPPCVRTHARAHMFIYEKLLAHTGDIVKTRGSEDRTTREFHARRLILCHFLKRIREHGPNMKKIDVETFFVPFAPESLFERRSTNAVGVFVRPSMDNASLVFVPQCDTKAFMCTKDEFIEQREVQADALRKGVEKWDATMHEVVYRLVDRLELPWTSNAMFVDNEMLTELRNVLSNGKGGILPANVVAGIDNNVGVIVVSLPGKKLNFPVHTQRRPFVRDRARWGAKNALQRQAAKIYRTVKLEELAARIVEYFGKGNVRAVVMGNAFTNKTMPNAKGVGGAGSPLLLAAGFRAVSGVTFALVPEVFTTAVNTDGQRPDFLVRVASFFPQGKGGRTGVVAEGATRTPTLPPDDQYLRASLFNTFDISLTFGNDARPPTLPLREEARNAH